MSTKLLKPLNLVACCLNISEGRNVEIIEEIAHAAVKDQELWKSSKTYESIMERTPKCKSTVLSVYSDPIFNRGNITIVAPVEYIATSVCQACIVAFNKIDLEKHIDRNHPRLGAVDLIPIHPICKTVSLKSCGKVALEIADRLVNKVKGSSFYTFGTADRYGKDLVEKRREMNWFSSSPNIILDIGNFSKTCGITGIGAIPYMSVLNVLLETKDLGIGKQIASSIRKRNVQTGLPGIQSMAFRKQSKVEIACNIETNDLQSECPVLKTDFQTLEDTIKRLADERNVKICGNTVRGFTPEEAYQLAELALTNGDIYNITTLSKMNSVFLSPPFLKFDKIVTQYQGLIDCDE